MANVQFEQTRWWTLPLCLVKCDLVKNSRSATGFGVGLSLADAKVRALGEAWERWAVRLLARTGSNGFAAGQGVAQASLNARREVIERELFRRAWIAGAGFAEYPLKSHVALGLKAAARLHGWDTYLFAIESNSARVLVGVLRNRKSGREIIDAIFFTGNNAEDRLVLSLLGSCRKEYAFKAPILPILERSRPQRFSLDCAGIVSEVVYFQPGAPIVARAQHRGWGDFSAFLRAMPEIPWV